MVIVGYSVIRCLGLLIGLALVVGFAVACSAPPPYDVVLRNGTIYDGGGGSPFVADVAINGDTIAAIGLPERAEGRIEIDATGLAVAPGFVNMMCWANESLIEDGHSQSDIRQGVTTEVLGEGDSMGPLNEAMKREMVRRQGDITYDIAWTTLDEYLVHLENRGVSTNVASFIEPHQYATGMVHVFVNGVQVLENGDHTGATSGRIVRGPGWTGVEGD